MNIAENHAALEAIEGAAFADLYCAAPETIRTSMHIDVADIAGMYLRQNYISPARA